MSESTKTFLDKHDISGVDTSCFIYKRTPQGPWQYCVGIPVDVANGRHNTIKKSCKTKDFEKAKRVAYDAYKEIWRKIDDKKSVHTKTFEQVALELLDFVKYGEPESRYKDYSQKIHNYLIPFFGEMDITKIKDVHITEFWDWRVDVRKRQIAEYNKKYEARCDEAKRSFDRKEERRKKEEGVLFKPERFSKPPYKPPFKGKTSFPASSIASENAPLKRVFKFACGGKNAVMKKGDIPTIGMPDKEEVQANIIVTRELNSRPAFNHSEIKLIQDHLRRRYRDKKNAYIHALKHSGSKKCKAIREAYDESELSSQWDRDDKVLASYRLYFAVNLLIATGMRTQTMLSLKVKHVSKRLENGDLVPVYKTGIRTKKVPGLKHMAVGSKLMKSYRDHEAYFHDGKASRYVFGGSTHKGGAERYVEIVPDIFLNEHLERYLDYIGLEDPERPLIEGISSHSLNTAFKRALAEPSSKLGHDFVEDRSIYSIRHYYITQKIIEKNDLTEIAKNCLTSVKVIQSYYDKASHLLSYDKLSGIEKLDNRETIEFE
ncbi:hypothetical protein RYZ26_17220 [Terasakiella sp. A23]|uniref:hypothetical protein n=1 Tax=Terasakiella sp. FCG-A23 TaxID=3080561 RepID=UPI002953E7FB|nr:hypothetical protein [Terasakiella sp. A23]MDV7341353.1 hypothetical protein [Terasakiella sp. A23]